MNQSPEGLEYSTDNDKYAKADKPESLLEKGKYDSARHASYANECDAAEALRMKDGGCGDPMYASNRKNM